MKITWNKYFALPLLAGILGFSACNSDNDPASIDPIENADVATVQFKLAINPDKPQAVEPDQLMRLFVGERKPEHGVEELHLLGVMEDVVEGHLTFNNLKPQWYKFAFVCVPRNGNNMPLNLFTEEDPGEATCDMNRILLDYGPILKLGAGSEDFGDGRKLPQGDIYCKVVSLWLEKDTTAKEDVVLTRLNGQLKLDMGILVDQFEHRVDSIVLELTNLPTRMYITDNDKGEIKTTTQQTVCFKTIPYNQLQITESKRKHHILIANLLPCELNGKVHVYTEDEKGNRYDFHFPLRTDSDKIFRIKPNTRTILHFNGISSEYFDVKYAGYDDTKINVDDDGWNGWKSTTPISVH